MSPSSTRRAVLVLVLAALVLAVAACRERPSLRIHIPLAPELYQFSALADAIREETGIEVVRYEPQPGDPDPLTLVAEGRVDLSVVENSARYVAGVQTVLPVYRGVLHVLYRKDLEVQTMHEALRMRKSLYIAGSSPVAHEFVDFLATRIGIERDSLNLVDRFEPGVTDLALVVSSILPDSLQASMPGYRLLSLDDIANLGHGSRVEAIPYLFPQLRPFVIPANTYPALGNEQPVVTVAVYMLLVCRAALPRDTVYELARGLMQRRAEFSQQLPELFHTLTDRVDPLSLKFPLHPGAADFINRNDPGFFERYADLISLATYLLIAVATSVVAVLRWNQRRRKDRIDRFYAELLAIRSGLRSAGTAELAAARERLDAIEAEAWQLLIAEKLAADESFRIFHVLLAETRAAAGEARS